MVSDEKIIASLIMHGTVKAAAAAVGLTERAVRERMHGDDFRELYAAAKADIVRKAVFDLQAALGVAVESVVSIMTDSDVNPAIRLQAAQTVLTQASRFASRLNADETRATLQHEQSIFGLGI